MPGSRRGWVSGSRWRRVKMGVADEFKRQGYRLEYEYGDGGDHTEVWINDEAGMAVKIERMKVEKMQ